MILVCWGYFLVSKDVNGWEIDIGFNLLLHYLYMFLIYIFITTNKARADFWKTSFACSRRNMLWWNQFIHTVFYTLIAFWNFRQDLLFFISLTFTQPLGNIFVHIFTFNAARKVIQLPLVLVCRTFFWKPVLQDSVEICVTHINIPDKIMVEMSE